MSISLIWGFLLAGVAGWTLLERIGFNAVSLEKLAYSVLFGLGLQSLWMFVFDVIHFQFSSSVLTVANLIFIIALSDFEKIKNFKLQAAKAATRKNLQQQFNNFNAGSLLILLVMAGLFYLIAVKSLFWPTTEHDAIGTFDKLGIWYAIEGKIHVSLYDVHLQGAGGIYPPLFHCSIAYSYLYGAENPKVLSLIYYVCSLIIFYGISKRYLNGFGAIVFTLVLAWAPEFFSHAALLLSNLPSTAYTTAAALPLFVWYKENNTAYFKVATLGIFFALWLRQDLIAFAVAGFALVLLHFFKHRNWRFLMGYSLAAIMSFAIWSLYVKYNLQHSAAERFGAGSVITLQKLQLALTYLWAYLGLGQAGNSPPGYFLYGIVFPVSFLLILISVKQFLKEWAFTILYFALALALYTLIFLLLDEKLQNADLQSLMESSFKRGIFCFMPLALFQAAVTEKVKYFFNQTENYLRGEEAL